MKNMKFTNINSHINLVFILPPPPPDNVDEYILKNSPPKEIFPRKKDPHQNHAAVPNRRQPDVVRLGFGRVFLVYHRGGML
jgi:hypothetical protein